MNTPASPPPSPSPPSPTPDTTPPPDDLAKLLDEPAPRAWYRRRMVWAAALSAVLLIAGVWYWQAKKSANAAPAYQTQPVARGNLSLTVTANGTLQPVRTTSIGSELSGTVLKVNVDVNDQIKKGQVLVELDTAKLRDQILRSRAAITAANARVAQAAATVKEARAGLGASRKSRACPAARCRRRPNWIPAAPPWLAPWPMQPAPRPASAMQKRRCRPT